MKLTQHLIHERVKTRSKSEPEITRGDGGGWNKISVKLESLKITSVVLRYTPNDNNVGFRSFFCVLVDFAVIMVDIRNILMKIMQLQCSNNCKRNYSNFN